MLLQLKRKATGRALMSTIKAVAKHAGVSVTTVSHALNRPERVTAELRERVMRSVRELGYEPNPSARTLRTGHTNLIALMLSDICNPFFPELARAVQDEMTHAYDVLIYNTSVPGGMLNVHASHYLRQLSVKRFDGVLIVAEAVQGAEPELANLRIPAVSIGNLDQPHIDSVTFDDFRAAYDAVAFLIQRGHYRIGHLAGDQGLWSGRERRRGYVQALADYGIVADERLIHVGTYQRPAGAEGMRFLLERDEPPTAVFAANALMAIAALGEAIDLGRSIPEDVAVVGYDDIAALSDVRPRITTVACSPHTIGRAAAKRLLERLHTAAPMPPQKLILPHSLIVREST